MKAEAAALCRVCGGRLIAAYPGQTMHPLCDPDPPTLSGETLERVAAQLDAPWGQS